MYSALLFLLLAGVSTSFAADQKIFVCYYGTWATYRPGLGKFSVEDVDTNLCTHVIYSFVGIDNQGTVVSLDPALDFAENGGRDNFRKFTNLKQKNPNLKTILAVGGWGEGSAKYSAMAGNATLRQNFIKSGIKMLRDYNFDGFDVDWEYPARRNTVHGNEDINNFSVLLKELRQEFDKYGLLLSTAVSTVEEVASLSYDIPEISKHVHHIHLMTYDLHIATEPEVNHNAALHKGDFDGDRDRNSLYTIDVAVEYWLREGCPPEKLILGIPLYGHTFTLANASNHDVRAPASGPGLAGPFTDSPGIIGYNEFCVELKNSSWTVKQDVKAQVPYAYRGSDWVSFEDFNSLKAKVAYALQYNLGGAMVWSIETDDSHNVCGGGKNPLLTTINRALAGKA